jgi:hypothetical protein
MKKQIKTVIVAVAFIVSYLGFTQTKLTHTVAGKQINISTVGLGNSASAYCNEAMFIWEVNAGVCTMAMNNPNAECLNAVSNTHNCVLAY